VIELTSYRTCPQGCKLENKSEEKDSGGAKRLRCKLVCSEL
jgi:hypothetical protein